MSDTWAEARLAKLLELQQLRAQLRERQQETVNRYLYDPVAFLHDMVDFGDGGPTRYQEQILQGLVEGRRMAVRSCHGAGKTSTVAFANIWFAVSREMAGIDWKAQITAGVWRQLRDFTMPEIRLWLRHLRWDKLGREPFVRGRELLELGLNLEHGSINTLASSDPAKLEGAHAKHLFYTLDESKVIIPGAWDAVEGAFSNAGNDTTSEAYVLAVSTPGPPAGRFYDIHSRKPGLTDWRTRHIKIEEAVEAGRVSADWVEQRRLQWGADSAIYKAKVLGEFCADDEDAVIPLAWVEAAVERWQEWARWGKKPLEGSHWVGVDVGRGGDESVLAQRKGPVVELSATKVRDTMEVVRLVQATGMNAIVDTIGVGAGVYDRLKEVGHKSIPYTGSARSTLRDRSRQYSFANVRSAAYWLLREALDLQYEPTLCLPPDDLLLSDLTTPRWSISPGVPPKIVLERKEDVVKRLGRSPDRGDAVVMCLFADYSRPAPKAWVPEGIMPATGLSPLG